MGLDVTDQNEMMAATTKVIAELTETMRDGAAVLGEAAATGLSQQFAARTRPVAVRPLATLEAAERAATTAVRWRHGLIATIERRGGRLLLRLPDRTVSFPGSCTAAVAAIHSGRVVDAATLPGLDSADGEVVIRRLLREAVVVPVSGGYGRPTDR